MTNAHFFQLSHGEEVIVTPFAQILASLRNVRNNYIYITNLPVPINRKECRRSSGSFASPQQILYQQQLQLQQQQIREQVQAQQLVSSQSSSSMTQPGPMRPLILTGQTDECTSSVVPCGSLNTNLLPGNNLLQKMAVETLEELEWCLEQLETIQAHR